MKERRTYLRGDVIKKRRKRAILRAFWIGVLSLVIIGSGIFLIRQDRLKIVSYQVNGVVEGNEKAIREIMDEYLYRDSGNLIPLNTFFTFPTNHIEELIKQDHIIDQVNVSRKMEYPFEIVVDIKEKKIAHTFCLISSSDGESINCSWFGLDKEGYGVKNLSGKGDFQSSSTAYISISSGLLNESNILGNQIMSKYLIDSIFAYSDMLTKFNYKVKRYQIFDAKTYLHIENNGYVIIPYGFLTYLEPETNQADVLLKINYLESVLSDSNISKNLYSSTGTSTTKVNNKINKKTAVATTTDKIEFEYIDARLAKKIFINPKSSERATTTSATSTATTTKKIR